MGRRRFGGGRRGSTRARPRLAAPYNCDGAPLPTQHPRSTLSALPCTLRRSCPCDRNWCFRFCFFWWCWDICPCSWLCSIIELALKVLDFVWGLIETVIGGAVEAIVNPVLAVSAPPEAQTAGGGKEAVAEAPSRSRATTDGGANAWAVWVVAQGQTGQGSMCDPNHTDPVRQPWRMLKNRRNALLKP